MSDNNNQNSNRTMIIPRPGGKKNKINSQKEVHSASENSYPSAQVNSGESQSYLPKTENVISQFSSEIYDKPIIELQTNDEGFVGKYFSGILVLASKLRSLPEYQNVDALHQRLCQMMVESKNKLDAENNNPSYSNDAAFFVCVVVDELILYTPWGASSNWSQKKMAYTFFQENNGGERFFEVIAVYLKSRQIEMLRLIHTCLNLGFKGRFALDQDAERKLSDLKNQIFSIIDQHKNSKPLNLNVKVESNWQEKKTWFLPLKTFGLLAIALLSVVYVGFLFNLNSQGDLVAGKVSTVYMQDVNSRDVMKDVVNHFKRDLGFELSRQKMELIEENGSLRLVLNVEKSFEKGSLTSELKGILQRISFASNGIEANVEILVKSKNSQFDKYGSLVEQEFKKELKKSLPIQLITGKLAADGEKNQIMEIILNSPTLINRGGIK